MSIRHHLGDALLLSHASGSLGEAWSLAVATHIALCPTCRANVARAEAIGGALVEEIAPAAMSENAFSSVLERLGDSVAAGEAPRAQAPVVGDIRIPEPLRSYVAGGGTGAGLPWRRLGLGAYQIPIATRDRSATARLLRIPAGKPVPEHGHGGLELTLVLSGAFTDGDAYFGPGDIEEADEAVVHKPHAVAGEDCICLAVTDAPLRFESPIMRMMQPLLKI